MPPDDQVVREERLCGSERRDFEQRGAHLHNR